MTKFLLTLLLIAQSFAIVLGFASATRNYLFKANPDALYILINTNIAILGLLLGAKIATEAHSVKMLLSGHSNLLSDLRTARGEISALAEDRFYSRFEEEIKHASLGVSLAHLDTRPPSKPKNSAGSDYYTNLPKLIKKSRARFRRVERASADKLDWLESQIKQFADQENYSLGVLAWDMADRKTAAVSVQLIDSDIAVLVAVAHHEGIQGPRDLWIRDAPSTRLWQEYYEQTLWAPSVKLIENGKVDQAAWLEIKRRYSPTGHAAVAL